MTLEQLKAEAHCKWPGNLPFGYTEMDNLVEFTHQATVEEIIKIAESLRGNESDGYYDQAIYDLIQAIKK